MNKQSRQLGELLVDRRLLTRDDLEHLLRLEENTQRPLARLVIDEGFVLKEDLLAALADQVGLAYVNLARTAPHPDAAALIPREVAEEMGVLGVELQNDVLVVAAVNPFEGDLRQKLKALTGKEIRPTLALREDIAEALPRAYPATDALAPAAPDAPGGAPYAPPTPAVAGGVRPLSAVPSGAVLGGAPAAPAAPAGAPPLAPSGRRREDPANPRSGHPVHQLQALSAVAKHEFDDLPHINELLAVLIKHEGSDLHLTVGTQPSMRVHGEMTRLTQFPVMVSAGLRKMIYDVLTQKQREKLEEDLELDCTHPVPDLGRFRMNVFFQRDAIGAVLRAIPKDIKSPEDLGLPSTVRRLADFPRGLVLVTGPTGSGKSTTLASILNLINEQRACHIMTVEDPIEFLHKHKRSVVNQREVGADTHGFQAALKHVLRQDPDVILVGEMRDLETIQVALTAAETGHLVFATLHTQDAPQSVDRVIDVFPPHQQQQIQVQLAASLQAVLSQQLIPTRDGKGRVCSLEIMIVTPAIRNLIREGKTHQIYSSMQAGGKFGMVTMDQSLAELVKRGLIGMDLAVERCSNVEDLQRLSGRVA